MIVKRIQAGRGRAEGDKAQGGSDEHKSGSRSAPEQERGKTGGQEERLCCADLSAEREGEGERSAEQL